MHHSVISQFSEVSFSRFYSHYVYLNAGHPHNISYLGIYYVYKVL